MSTWQSPNYHSFLYTNDGTTVTRRQEGRKLASFAGCSNQTKSHVPMKSIAMATYFLTISFTKLRLRYIGKGWRMRRGPIQFRQTSKILTARIGLKHISIPSVTIYNRQIHKDGSAIATQRRHAIKSLPCPSSARPISDIGQMQQHYIRNMETSTANQVFKQSTKLLWLQSSSFKVPLCYFHRELYKFS